MDDIAGRYSDWQDRQDKLNREPEEVARDTVADFLTGYWDKAQGVCIPDWDLTYKMFQEAADNLIKDLESKGFTITIRKEVT